MKKITTLLIIISLTVTSYGQQLTNLIVTNINDNNVTLNWDNGNCATNSYDLSYKESSSSVWITINDSISSVSYNLANLYATTTYNWKVKCSVDSTWTNGIDFTTLSSTCNKSLDQHLNGFNPNPVYGLWVWSIDTLSITNTSNCDLRIRPEFEIFHENFTIGANDFDLKWYNPYIGNWPDIPYYIDANGNANGFWGFGSDSTGTQITQGTEQQIIVKIRFRTNANPGTYSANWTTQEVDSIGNFIQTLSDGDSSSISLADCSIFNIDSSYSSNISCFNDNNGSAAIVSIQNGSNEYSYNWSNSMTGNLITGLAAGTYTLTVSDNNGCQDSTTVSLSNSGALVISTASTPASCNGGCTGTGTVFVPLVGGPWSIQWSSSPNDTNITVNNLCVGTYFVTVEDQFGCVAIDSIQVAQQAILNLNLVTANNTPCDGNCTGSVTAEVQGGSSPFTYAWSNSTVTDSVLSDLCAGNYTVTVTSADGCTGVASASILDNLPFTVNLDSVVDASCMNTNDGSAFLTATGGASPYTYSWSGNGLSASTEDISFVLSGQYIYTFTDASGCVQSDTVTIDSDVDYTVRASDTTICAMIDSLTLSVQVNGVSGATYQWFDENGIPLGTDSTQTVPFVPGDTLTYPVQVFFGGCFASDTSNVRASIIPQVDAGNDSTIVRGESIEIGGNPTTDMGGSTYSWSPAISLDNPVIDNPTASPRETTTYTVFVTNILGCTGSDDVTVFVNDAFEYPSGYSPNGDGTNDVWELDFLAKYPDCTVQIFNRWGQVVFESEGYEEPWDGKMNGEDLPIGTYYYVIDLGNEDITKPLTGPVTLMR